ncbi:MAG TPA: pyridoxamine 5'-phosphate oxidase family protein [Woeseiaceae bacterium]|nr:pyridoxamine 5'-phosphate oxidase family protein [Woeseiaceae bacterium]
MSADPFHEGERLVQARAGEREGALRTGGMLAERIPPRALPFLVDQRILAIGTGDDHSAMHASLLSGERSFVSSTDGGSVLLDRARLAVARDDPVWVLMRRDIEVGLLAIEFETRRRLRINGVVRRIDDGQVEIGVREAYANCPKYVQRRHLRDETIVAADDTRARARGTTLTELRSFLETADTFFVASRHPARGVDVSHRGGMPGFIRLLDDRRIRIPDYRGNSMFNTLGNFASDPRAGLAFPDFDGGTILQMTGTARLHFAEEEDPRQPTGGTRRYWEFQLAEWQTVPILAPFAWELVDYSPHNPHARV